MGSLDGRTVLITGGTRGIGLAAARGVGQQGAHVVVVGRDAQRAAEVARELRAEGIDVAHDVADVASADGMDALATRVPSPDILIASAGVMSERMTKIHSHNLMSAGPITFSLRRPTSWERPTVPP